jgi:chromosome segregation ATPase
MMAKNPVNEFSKSKNFRDLDENLKLAFVNIKNDMTALREGLHQQGMKVVELVQDVKESKADFITVDKFNIIKIKIGELNENLKKLWEIEKKLEDLDRKTVAESDFDKHTGKMENELAKLKQDLAALDKTSATEQQLKDFAQDINSEFDGIKRGIEELRSIKDSITRAEMDKRTDILNKRADEVRKDFEKVRSEVKDKINVKDVEAFVFDVNKEFDILKKAIVDFKDDSRKYVTTSEFERSLDKLNNKVDGTNQKLTAVVDEFSKGMESAFKDFLKVHERNSKELISEVTASEERLSEEIAENKKEMKDFVTRKQAENLLKDLNKEFDALKDDSDKLTKGLAELGKESASKEELHTAFDNLRESLLETNQAMKEMYGNVLKAMKHDSDDVNRKIKDNSQDINEIERAVGKELKLYVLKDELEAELEAMQEELDKMPTATDVDKQLRKSISVLEDEYVEKKQFNKLVDVVSMLQERVELQRELVKEKKKELKTYGKQLKAAKKAEKKLAKYEAEYSSMVEKSQKAVKKAKNGKNGKNGKEKKEYNKSSFLANFLIVVAFLLLIAAIGFFFSGMSGLTDSLSIAAVVCFVLGIILRIVVALKRSD